MGAKSSYRKLHSLCPVFQLTKVVDLLVEGFDTSVENSLPKLGGVGLHIASIVIGRDVHLLAVVEHDLELFGQSSLDYVELLVE